MAPAAQSQRNAAEILGQAVKPPERIAIGSRGMARQLPGDYSLPGLRQSRRRDNLPATAGRHRDQSSPSPGRHQGDRHTKLRSRGRARDPARQAGLPVPVPRPRIAGWPGRGRARHPPVRHPHLPRLPVGGQPPAPRRRLRLRRRLPARQPVGSGHLRRGPRPRQGPPARRPHHRPRLDLCHLALLARTASPTTPPSTTPCRTSWPGSRLAGPRPSAPRISGDGRGQRRAARLRGRHLPRRSSPRSS